MGVSNHLNRPWTKRAAAVAAITGAAFYGIAAGSVAHAAPGTSSLMAITGVSPHHVAALTTNQVITVTGTGFDEDSIKSVSIAHCTTDPMYIVQSSTTLLLKTAGDCAVDTAGEATSGRVITVTDTGGNNDTAVSNPAATGGKMALNFVAAPSILTADATHRPVVTEYSSALAYGSQVHSGSTSGGTVVRVFAGSTYFANSTAYPLAASLGGVAMTGITLHKDSSGNGDYFTGVLGVHAASTSPALKITSNGVTKSFLYGAGGASATDQTHDFTYAGATISVAPAFGGVHGGNTLTVSGAGFTSSTTVTVGGNACTVTGTVTATKLSCTVPAGTAAGPVSVVVTTGSLVSVTSAGSTYTYLDQ